MSKVISIKNLSKNYGAVRALDDVSFELEEGRIYGLLGRNGAGKSTLLNLISSRIYARQGSITLFGGKGVDNPAALARICHMPEKDLFPEAMRVREIIRTAYDFYPGFDLGYAEELCRTLGLETSRRFKALSRGQASYLRIVLGLASRADITILDEPVLGLDAAARDHFYQTLVKDYSEQPRTFILSTHLIDESADIFEEVLILKEGRLIAFDPVEKLRENACVIAGRTETVDAFVREHELIVMTREGVGHLESVAIQGRISQEQGRLAEEAGLDLAPVSLQKLFIYMTESEERRE